MEGQNQTSQSTPVNNPVSSKGSGLSPNLAGALAYLFAIFSGIYFIITEKNDKFVRFHAWQSIFLTIAYVVASVFAGIIPTALGDLVGLIVTIGGFVIWLYLMYMAYSGKEYKLPYIGEMAMEQVNK